MAHVAEQEARHLLAIHQYIIEKLVPPFPLQRLVDILFDVKMEFVDLLPGLRGDNLPGGACVFPCGLDRAYQGCGIGLVGKDELDDVAFIGPGEPFVEQLGAAGNIDEIGPYVLHHLRQIQKQVRIDADKAGDVFGPLVETAEPVHSFRDA